MYLYLATMFFLLGIILGSFYNVVGYRIPKGESIISPGSHCTNCNHFLTPIELIPVLSYFLQKGKCKKCKQKISLFYPIFEFSCGILFVLAYLSFGLTFELLIALTFISMVIIVVLSDYYYMIIPDSVLIVFTIMLLIETYFINGFSSLLNSLLDGVIAFGIMYALKLFGDMLFKKESMGGGDIKLLFVFGLVLGWEMSIISIFLASFIGLPVSIIIMKKKGEHIIPFGPFLSIGAIIILLTQIDINFIIKLFY